MNQKILKKKQQMGMHEERGKKKVIPLYSKFNVKG